MYRFKFQFLAIIAFALIVSCIKKKGVVDSVNTDFNKATILENIGNNIIIANYEKLDAEMIEFELKYNAFIADKTPANFTELQGAWTSTYFQWESSLMFEFGPAMEQLFKLSLGTFPTDTVKVLNNISTGAYDLYQVSNATAQGLPAFDFLLFRNNAIAYFSEANYAKYGTDLITKMKDQTETVLNAWKSNYLATFVAATGTATTSSFPMMVNEFVKSYEECKWTKIGIPIGRQSLGGQMPEYIETRYSKQSFALMLENMYALHRLFNGNKADGTVGVGFDDYLIALDRTALANTINTEFEGIIALMHGFTTDFETALTNNPAGLDALYTKVHNLTVSLKTDMTSAFGVMITYQDNDGD